MKTFIRSPPSLKFSQKNKALTMIARGLFGAILVLI